MEAVDQANKVLSIDPDNYLGLMNISSIYLEQGELDSAYSAATKAIKLNPVEILRHE